MLHSHEMTFIPRRSTGAKTGTLARPVADNSDRVPLVGAGDPHIQIRLVIRDPGVSLGDRHSIYLQDEPGALRCRSSLRLRSVCRL